MWLALKLLGSGALETVLKGLSAALGWLLADWRNLALSGTGAALAWTLILTVPALRADLAAVQKWLEDEQLSHLQTIANYIDASAEAQRQAEANRARVEAEQERITDEVTRDLRSDLADLGARFDRLRARNAARTDPGGADAAGLPGLPDAAGRIAAAAPDHHLPAAGEPGEPGELSPQPACPADLICLTIDQAEAASQDAHRHNRLIDWVFGQSAISFTPEPQP